MGLVSLTETSRSTVPLWAAMKIGPTGNATMTTTQTATDEKGVRTGPSPMGDQIENMIPT
ncbi:hypothetical protein EU524_02185 [Candidatus Thorarchaeota archaeon]|nr:MAG: hypothetical protein EU524_02185 [Candidatus Thorarchaeota archaeon]